MQFMRVFLTFTQFTPIFLERFRSSLKSTLELDWCTSYLFEMDNKQTPNYFLKEPNSFTEKSQICEKKHWLRIHQQMFTLPVWTIEDIPKYTVSKNRSPNHFQFFWEPKRLSQTAFNFFRKTQVIPGS